MLEIGVLPKQGTAGLGRFFPFTGYLGLSPVVIAGSVHARLPPLCRPLAVRQVLATVKCCETRTCHSLAGSDVEAVIWEKTKRIWEPAGDAEYEDMGDWEGSFKLAIPVEVARMTASTQCTRDSKIVWRLELTFDHKPIPYVGTRITRSHLLNIKSYASPPISPPTPQPAIVVPGATIHVRPPLGAYGPGDTFRLEFDVRPDDPNTLVRKGLVQLDRRSEPLAIAPDVSLAMPAKALEVRKHRPREKRSFFRRSRSTSADTSPSPVLQYEKLDDEVPSPPPTAQTPPTVVRSSVMEIITPDPVVSSSGFSFEATGTIPRRSHKWDAGETGRTRLLATSFELRIRFALKTKKSPSKEVVCPPIPIILVGASQEERETAQTTIAELAASGKAKAGLPAKKRHRSSRRGLYMQEGTIEISDPVVTTSAPRDASTRRASPPPDIGADMASDDIDAGPVRPRLSDTAATGVKPILLRAKEATSTTGPAQGISFALPSRTDVADADMLAIDAPIARVPSPARQGGLNIHELIHPTFNNASPFSPRPADAAPAFASDSRHAPVPHIGRRISSTTSEEEDAQPCRSRQRRNVHAAHTDHNSPSSFAWSGTDIKMTVTPATTTLPSTPVLPLPPDPSVARPSLPSLDTLGLGLPKVPEYDRTPRPRTAPSVSIFPNSAWNNIRSTADDDAPRPVTSAGFGLGLQGGGSSVNLATNTNDPMPSQSNDGRSRVFGNATAMSSATSFGSTSGLLPQWDARTAITSSGPSDPPVYEPSAAIHRPTSSRIRPPPTLPDSNVQRTMTTVVPVLNADRERDQGYRVGAGSFAPAISQQQQIQQALAAEQRTQAASIPVMMGLGASNGLSAESAPAPPARRRSSVFGLGGRGFGRTEEGSFAFGLRG